MKTKNFTTHKLDIKTVDLGEYRTFDVIYSYHLWEFSFENKSLREFYIKCKIAHISFFNKTVYYNIYNCRNEN